LSSRGFPKSEKAIFSDTLFLTTPSRMSISITCPARMPLGMVISFSSAEAW
jgi:hypothetical protein